MSHTISTLTPADLESYRKALKNRAAATQGRAASRLQKAHEIASSAASLLRNEFGVERVVMFGSLVHPRSFHSHSNVDLAVWGLTGRRYYRAVGILQSLDPEIEVDLIAFEDASKSIQEIILREGVVMSTTIP